MNGFDHLRRARLVLGLCFSLLVTGLTLFFPPPPHALANVITVDTLADDNIANNNCTLREAITAAFTNLPVDNCVAGGPAGDTITFAPGLSGTIVLTSSLPFISQDLTIDAPPGITSIAISGNNSYRVFLVQNGVTMNLSNVSIVNGKWGASGGIFIDGGTLIVNNVTFSGNQSVGNSGGAIYNSQGTLTINNATVYSNTATGSGGGIFSYGNATISNLSLYGNTAGISGGGIYQANSILNVSASQIYSNTSLSDGGGIYLNNSGLFLASSSVYSNTAMNANGGGIYSNNSASVISSSAITSNVAISNSNQTGMGGGIYSSAGLFIRDSNLSNNRAANMGGGIFAITTTGTITNSTLAGNHAMGVFGGGALLVAPNGILFLDKTTLNDNVTTIAGGAISNLGTMTVTNSSIYSNTATSFGGGGILNFGTMTMTNVTIASNHGLGTNGGGIYNACFTQFCTNSGIVTVTNGTIAGNSAPFGGGIFNDNTLSVALVNTVVANNTAGTGGNCLGTITDGGKNLQWNPNTGCGFALAAGDPKLAPLGNYGGPTKTMGLFQGSAALDAASSAACPATDQRGIVRPQGILCDIGAFEGSLMPLYLPLIKR